jgi:acyl carrier protein
MIGKKKPTERECWTALTDIITQILDDMGEDPGDLTRETMINADLGLSSIEAIHIAISLENALRISINFESLAVRDGEYVDDLAIGEIHDFVLSTIGLTAESPQGA